MNEENSMTTPNEITHAATESALDRLNASGINLEQETPLERLRFFCSLAMSGQDWLDVEPFFDAVSAAAPVAQEPSAHKLVADGWLDDHITENVKFTRGEMPGVYYCQGWRDAEAHYKLAAQRVDAQAVTARSNRLSELLQSVEDALDAANATIRRDDGHFLTLPERIAALAAQASGQDREDAERVRNAAAILDTLTSNLVEGHPLRAEADEGAKRAVADLYRIADQVDARAAAKGEA